jgi:hypothetical protein
LLEFHYQRAALAHVSYPISPGDAIPAIIPVVDIDTADRTLAAYQHVLVGTQKEFVFRYGIVPIQVFPDLTAPYAPTTDPRMSYRFFGYMSGIPSPYEIGIIPQTAYPVLIHYLAVSTDTTIPTVHESKGAAEGKPWLGGGPISLLKPAWVDLQTQLLVSCPQFLRALFPISRSLQQLALNAEILAPCITTCLKPIGVHQANISIGRCGMDCLQEVFVIHNTPR